jgi:hypothetical protein
MNTRISSGNIKMKQQGLKALQKESQKTQRAVLIKKDLDKLVT